MVVKNISLNKIMECENFSEDIKNLKRKITEYQLLVDTEVENASNYIKQNALDKKEAMRYIEGLNDDIREYVKRKYLGIPYNVLKKSDSKYKTLRDIGIEVFEEDFLRNWMDVWKSMVSDYDMHKIDDMFESHAHYNLDNYKGYGYELIDLLFEAGLKGIVIPSISYEDNWDIKYKNIYYAFGIHPKKIKDIKDEKDVLLSIEKLLEDDKCVAVGEVGLDYDYKDFNANHREHQKQYFSEFIKLANKHNLPLVLHIRRDREKEEYDAVNDAISILESLKIKKESILHCFNYGIKEMNLFINNGVKYFGIGGKIFFNDKLQEAVKNMPNESIILETDSPYVKIHENSIPNTSLSLIDIAKKVAEIRETNPENVFKLSYDNSKRLFRI